MSELGDHIFEKYQDQIEEVCDQFMKARGDRGATEDELVALITWCTTTFGMRDLLEYIRIGEVTVDVNPEGLVAFNLPNAADAVRIEETEIDDAIRRILEEHNDGSN